MLASPDEAELGTRVERCDESAPQSRFVVGDGARRPHGDPPGSDISGSRQKGHLVRVDGSCVSSAADAALRVAGVGPEAGSTRSPQELGCGLALREAHLDSPARDRRPVHRALGMDGEEHVRERAKPAHSWGEQCLSRFFHVSTQPTELDFVHFSLAKE